MAKGFANYIMEEHRKVEAELLIDAYKKYQKNQYPEYEEEERLFEDVKFKD